MHSNLSFDNKQHIIGNNEDNDNALYVKHKKKYNKYKY